MSDRPILFSAPMVRALLNGRKTQTRRVLKPQPEVFQTDEGPAPVTIQTVEGEPPRVAVGRVITRQVVPYQVGDRLWCRETWALELQETGGAPVEPKRVLYAATDSWEGPAVPSIHMPRWASRLTLIVTGVKIERLNDISEEDAAAEGARAIYGEPFYEGAALTDRRRFQLLWEELHGPDSWESNPWVVAITFRVLKANIDAQEARAG